MAGVGPGRLRALVVEDSELDALLVVRELAQAGFDVEHERVEDAPSMRAALTERGPWDLVISDYTMPCFSAPDALRLLQAQGMDIPFLVVSGGVAEEMAAQTMRAGAHDYLLKDNLVRLGPVVARELREAQVRRAQRRAAEALRASELRFRRLANSGLLGIVVAGDHGGVIDANDYFLDLLGYTRQDLDSGRLCGVSFTPEDWRARDQQALEQLRFAGRVAPYEKELLRRDGSRVPVLMGLAHVGEQPGEVVAFVLDLSEHKRAERELEAARARAELAGDRAARLQAATAAFSRASTPSEVVHVLVHDGLAALGAQAGAISLLDPSGCTLELMGWVGYDPEVVAPFQALSIEARSPVPDAARTGQPVWLRNSDEWDARYSHRRRRLFELDDAAAAALPLRMEGRLLGAVWLSFGRPQVFDAEERAFIQALVDQCAQALERARLYEAERRARAEAEAALRAREEFLSIASHELRNPIAAIKGHIQLVQRFHRAGRLDDHRLERILRQVSADSDRLAVLTEDLLDVSRLRSGALTLRRRMADLREVVRAAIDDVQSQWQEGQYRVVLEQPDEPVMVRIDPGRIDQVVANLLDNAAKYSPNGGEVRVTLAVDETGAVLRIRDEGIGLPPGAEERIFEPFGRAANAQQRNLPGMGLGLYICRQIVASHGGRMGVESEGEDRGTTVWAWFPRETGDRAHDQE